MSTVRNVFHGFARPALLIGMALSWSLGGCIHDDGWDHHHDDAAYHDDHHDDHPDVHHDDHHDDPNYVDHHDDNHY